MFLSVSDFLSYKQCPKSFWLRKKTKVINDDEKRPRNNEVFDEVTEVARKLFPSGVLVDYNSDKTKMLKQTQRLMQEGVQTIFEATFELNGAVAIVDVISKSKNGWYLFGISPSTSLKVRFLDSVIFHTYIVSEHVDITGIYGITINNKYVRQDEQQLDQLFTVEDVSELIQMSLPSVSSALVEMKQLLFSMDVSCDIGRYCHKYEKDDYECPAKAHCWAHIPEYSVFNISRIGDKAFDFYKQGIVNVGDISNFENLSNAQSEEVRVHKEQINIIDLTRIRDFILRVQYPIYFLDFECFQMRIPYYDGIKPYQQLPFQYSLHYLEHRGATPTHKEFLAKEGTDPRRSFAENLTSDIPRDSTVLVYSHFENTILKTLIEQLPEYATHLQAVTDGFVDLIIPFRDRAYLTPKMRGKSSIKYVLPALFPDDTELNYQNLNIQNGIMAMTAYEALHHHLPNEIEQIRQQLLDYCRLDTLAMVKIWGHLNELI